jgi:hypothetical protein
VKTQDNVNFVLPQRVRMINIDDEVPLFMRVKFPQERVVVSCSAGGRELCSTSHQFVSPPEMIVAKVKKSAMNSDNMAGLLVRVKENLS